MENWKKVSVLDELSLPKHDFFLQNHSELEYELKKYRKIEDNDEIKSL